MKEDKNKCGYCEHYCKFEDKAGVGICDKTDEWNTVFAINKGCENVKIKKD